MTEMEKQNQELRERVDRLEAGLNHIQERNECDRWLREGESGEDPGWMCTCDHCVATRALRFKPAGYDWRYRGVMHERISFNAREARMIRSFADKVGDDTLSLILFGGDRRSYPTARDWYVASSIVQWLATNVGMGVLEAAGFHYSRFTDDRGIEERHAVSTELGQPNKPLHGRDDD